MIHRRLIVSLLLLIAITGLSACGGEPTARDGSWQRIQPDELSGPQAARFKRAEAARKNLAKTLFGRLTRVMSSEGPASAIEVCNLEARGMTDRVGRAHDVRIGRTSFRLRNPNNTPPDWARQFDLVEKRVDEQVILSDDQGDVAVLTPIHLKEKCAACHGPTDQLNEAVKQALAGRYPNDKATGFTPGELRGWFWVEVPADGST